MLSAPSKLQRLASRPLRVRHPPWPISRRLKPTTVLSQRGYHDIVTSKNPNKQPAIQYGPPGRSAISGQVATVFGCTGFLGRYLVAKLGVCSRSWEAFTLRGRVFSECMLACLRASRFVLPIFLAKAGTQVIVPFRDEDEKRHLKVMGDLGQIVPLVRSVPNPKRSLCVRSAHAHSFGLGMGPEERTTNRRVPETL